MKKNKLIELLQSIDGNPDIYLWNGYVDDYVEIDPRFVESILVKHNKAHIYDMIKHEYIRDKKEWSGLDYADRLSLFDDEDKQTVDRIFERSWKTHYNTWEEPNRYVRSEDFKRWYSSKKTVYFINAKTKGKTYSDRIGEMKY